MSPTTESIHQSQTLLIDADDTLWENNIYFERAIVRFISFLNHHEFSPEQVRQVLNDVERECIVKHGYGLHSFAHALGGVSLSTGQSDTGRARWDEGDDRAGGEARGSSMGRYGPS